MKSNYLLPNRLKKPGWILFLLGFILGIVYLLIPGQDSDDILPALNAKWLAIINEPPFGYTNYFTIIQNNLFDEIIGIMLIVGSVFIAFSKEKTEDEFIAKIRLESLVWATYFNYAILLLSMLFVFHLSFLWIIEFNMFTILIFFIIRFNWVLHTSKKQLRHEE